MIPSDLKILLCIKRKCYNLNTLTTLNTQFKPRVFTMSEINQTLDNSKFGFTDNELKLIETVTKKSTIRMRQKAINSKFFLLLSNCKTPLKKISRKFGLFWLLRKNLFRQARNSHGSIICSKKIKWINAS